MERPKHLFVSSCDGAMHDTRVDGWHRMPPLRANFERSHQWIKSVADLKATLRAGPYAWPGGYPMYFITSDGAALSFATVRAEFRLIADAVRTNDRNSGWHVIATDINWEDESLYDDHTGKQIECAYPADADDDADTL